MHPLCTDRMKIAGELLDHGIIDEGARKLSNLHDCGRRVGCDKWHLCVRLVERQWQSSRDVSAER